METDVKINKKKAEKDPWNFPSRTNFPSSYV